MADLFGPKGPTGGVPLNQLGISQYPPFQPSAGYQTQLNPLQEMQFLQWVKDNRVPFDVSAKGPTDYDMRGFWLAMNNGNPMARPTEVNGNDGLPHYTDYFKTPLHNTFSSESQWADTNTPSWANDHQLAAPNGRVVYDELPTGFAKALADLGKSNGT